MKQESQIIEFKQSWRDEYLKWICGFANADGGTLFIGMNDDGKVAGIADAPRLLEEIPNKVRDLLGIVVDVHLRSTKEGQFIEIIVEPFQYPISYKGQYHYRSGSTKQELRGIALDRFLLRKQGKHWDSIPVPHVSIDELNEAAIDTFKERALKSNRLSMDIVKESEPLLLEKLHLFDNQYLKRAAILLFHPDPEKYVSAAYIKIGFFKNDADLLYHDEIHGNLFTQVDQALDLILTKYLKASISYQGIQRVEKLPVPEAALREVLLNAVVHKDYASSTPIQISVYEDKIMFWNPGVLPLGWTIETLTNKHASHPFNPDIANTFFRAGMIEAWGRGIERIFTACQDFGSHSPELKYEESGMWVIIPFLPKKEEAQGAAKAPVETPVKTPVKTSEMIVAYMKKNPETTLEGVAENIGKSVRAVERAASKLVKAGKIKHIGPKKSGRWQVLM